MRPRTSDRGPAFALALALLLAGLANSSRGDTTRVKTGRGTFLVEIDAPDLAARGDGDDLVLVGPGDEELRLRLEPERPEGSSREPVMTIRREGRPVVTIRRISTARVQPTASGPGRTILGGGGLGPAWALAITPDGKTLASGHQGSLRVWDLATRTERFGVPVPKIVRRVAFTPDGSTIASAEYTFVGGKPVGNVVVRDGKTGEARRMGKPVDTGLHGVAIDHEGKVIVSSSWGEADMHVWDAATAGEVGTLKGHTGAVSTIAYSPDGKTLASAGDTTVRLWDVDTGTVRKIFRGHTKSVESLAFSADGKTLASGGGDDTARAWDVATGKLLATIECDDPVLAVAISPDGKAIASASARWGNGFYGQAPAEVQVWDVASSRRLAKLPDQPNQVFGMVFTPDGKSLITASLSGAVIVWDLAEFRAGAGAPK